MALLASGAILVIAAAFGAASGSAALKQGSAVQSVVFKKAVDPCASRKQYFIYFATHARPHPFWTPLNKGAIEGASSTCMRQKWTQSPGAFDFAETVNRIRIATAEKPDVLVVSMADPRAAESAVRDAIRGGITVINVNANDRRPVAEQPNYLTYVGIADEYDTGVAAAKALLKFKKAKSVVVGISAPGAVNLERRAKGWDDTMKAAGAKLARIDVQANPVQVMETYLVAHPDVDGFYIMGTGPNGSTSARDVIAKLGKRNQVTLVGGDPALSDLEAIRDGTQLAGIQQQQYLQGFFPPVLARMYFETGQVPLVVSTGPGTVDKTNVAQAIKLAQWGLR